MNKADLMTIPSRAHFCWIGANLPWAYVFALLSAADRSELQEIILHHTDTLTDGPELRALLQVPRVRLSLLNPPDYLAEVGTGLGLGDELAKLYHSIKSPAILSDILRAAILYREGGVYLDLDTIITASLRPLLDTTQFVGSEYIVWPQSVRDSRSLPVWARHLALDVTRKIMQQVPNGWIAFKKIERFYFVGINGAVMGAASGSPLCANYLRAMSAVPPERAGIAYALGPDLLQKLVVDYQGKDLIVHEPEIFFPLPPEISEHWFRIGGPPRLAAALGAGTRVVHWYASVRTRSRVAAISPAYVQAHRDTQLYSALVCACIPGVAEMA